MKAWRVVVDVSANAVSIDDLARVFETIPRPPYAGFMAYDPQNFRAFFFVEAEDARSAEKLADGFSRDALRAEAMVRSFKWTVAGALAQQADT